MSLEQRSPAFNQVEELIAELQNQLNHGSLGKPKKLLIMLDYDGTLVPFADRPEKAVPGTGVLDTLRRLLDREYITLAVISGRTLPEIEQLVPLPGLMLAALHGALIRYPEGRMQLLIEGNKDQIVRTLIQDIKQYFDQNQLPGGFWIENKGISMAVHFRNVPESQVKEGLDRVIKAVEPLMEKNALELLAGDKVLEIRPCGINKGKAVSAVVSRYPDHYPVYIGDDYTDEDAFTALGDRGLSVRVSEELRDTAAQRQLRNPEETLRFLEGICLL